MAWLVEQWRRLMASVRRDALEQELEEEMALHRELRAARLRREGVSGAEAEEAARRRFGSTMLAAEDCRAFWGWQWLAMCGQDARYALRQMKRSTAFTVSALATLGLGIGSAVLVFAVLYAVVLRPLPFREPERMVMVWIDDAKRRIREEGVSWVTYRDWLARSRSFEELAARGRNYAILIRGAEPERVLVDVVTANYLPMLGVNPQAGRFFTEQEEARKETVVTISHGLAMRRFGSAAAAVGGQLEMEGKMWRVVGVMPAGFGIPPSRQDVWMPARSFPVLRAWESRGMDFFMGVGRLKAGATLQSASNELNEIGRQLAKEFPQTDPDFGGYGVAVVSMQDQVLGKSLPRTLWMLLGAVGLLLFVASVNVANLMLARWKARQGEFAVRAALGAGVGALLRQQWMEGLVLAACGCLLGLGVAGAGLRFVAMLRLDGVPRLEELSMDPKVVAFSIVVSLAACLLFGMLPAWLQARRDPQGYLLAAGKRVTDGGIGRMQSALVAMEIGLAFSLAMGAGLFLRSLWNVRAVDAGFEARHAVLAHVEWDMAGSKTSADVLYRDLLARLRSLPEVEAAGAIGDFFIALNPDYSVTVQGRATESREQITVDPVSTGFLEAAGARLLRGRFLVEADYLVERPAAVVINETFARRFFAGEDAVGKHLKFGTAEARGPWIEVVGVIADMHRRGLDQRAVCEGFGPALGGNMDVVVRTAVSPERTGAALRAAVRAMGAGHLVHGVTTLETKLEELTAHRRMQAWSMSGFALLTVLLAAVGIGGAMQYAVTERRRETAIRMAVGASARSVRLLVLRHAAANVAAGLVLGSIVGVASHRVVANLLFGVAALDPGIVAMAAAAVVAVATVACWMPARRAARMDPAVLLRE